MRVKAERLLCPAHGAFVADGQFVTALGTAARQNCPPVGRFHAHTKPVCLGAVPIVRLKCTFWHYKSFLKFLLGLAEYPSSGTSLKAEAYRSEHTPDDAHRSNPDTRPPFPNPKDIIYDLGGVRQTRVHRVRQPFFMPPAFSPSNRRQNEAWVAEHVGDYLPTSRAATGPVPAS